MVDSSVGTRALLRERDFLLYLIARCLGSLAVQMQTVAVGWQVYSVSHKPMDLGLVGLSQFLPFVLLILPAGHVADHRDRRRILSLCYVLQTVCALLLLLFTYHGLHSAVPVFAVMLLFGTARAFSMPTGQALLPNLVAPDSFGRAVALNSSVFQLATVAGPALGGLLYLAGPLAVYGAVSSMLAVSVVLMSGVKKGGRSEHATRGGRSWRELLSGLRFVRDQPIVLGAISLDLFAVLFGGATALLPAIASDFLQIGPLGLGILRAAPGVGATVCALWLTIKPISRHVGAWMFGGVAVFGVATLVFGLCGNFWWALVSLATLGAADMVSVFIRHLLVQLATPDEIRGRVSAVNGVFIGASNELGEFESGLTAAWWGVVPAIVVGGLATMGVGLLWSRLFPSLRTMDRFQAPVAQTARAG